MGQAVLLLLSFCCVALLYGKALFSSLYSIFALQNGNDQFCLSKNNCKVLYSVKIP